MAEGLRHPNLVRLVRWEKRLPRPYMALEAFVMSCLARGPGRRPRSAIDAAVELHRVLEGFGNDELLAWPRRSEVRSR